MFGRLILYIFVYLIINWFPSISAQQVERKIIIAHRGGYEVYPEQTIPAYELSASHKVDYIECDVWLTADSQAILIHDGTYSRTTNVVDIYGSDKQISDLTFQQARNLFISGGYGWKDDYKNQFRIPTLDEFINIAKKYNVGINIEVKLQHAKTRALILESLEKNNFDLNKVILNNFYSNISPPPWKMASQTGQNSPPKLDADSNGILIGNDLYYTVSDTSFAQNSLEVSFRTIFSNVNIKPEEIIKIVSRYNLDKYYFLLRIAVDSTLLVQYRQLGGGYSSKKTNYKFIGGELKGSITITDDSLTVMINDSTSFIFLQPSFLHEVVEPRLIIGTLKQPTPFRLKHLKIKNGIIDSLIFDIENNINTSTYRTRLVPYNFNIQPMDYIGLAIENYSKELTSYYHDLGYKTCIWTVNDKEIFKELLKNENVHGVYTGSPLLFDTILNNENQTKEVVNIPEDAEIKSVYPNPFNGQCKIVVNIKKPNNYKIKITDLLGREVSNIVDQFLASNQYVFEWNGKDLNNKTAASGTYFVLLQSENYRATSKILYLR